MSTTIRVEVLNAPSIAADPGNVTFAVVDSAGTTRIARTNAGVAALGSAGYSASFSYDLSWPTQARIDWYYLGAVVASGTFDVPAGGVDSANIAAILTKLNAAGTTVVTGGNVPDQAGVIKIEKGDGYYLADGYPVGPFNNTSSATYVSAVLKVFGGPTEVGVPLYTIPAVVTGSPGAWVFTADLTESQTSGMMRATHAWELVAALSSGHTRTLARGSFAVSD